MNPDNKVKLSSDMKNIKKRNASKFTFDIFNQPFYLLGITPSANAEEIAEAFEDRLSEGEVQQSELLSARQSVTNPKQRIKAELASFLDTPDRAANTLLDRIKVNANLASLKDEAARLSPISSANLIAHIASQHPADVAILRGLVRAHANIDVEILAEKIKQIRKSANLPYPTSEQLHEALHDLFEAHYKAVFEGYSNIDEAVKPVSLCYATLCDESEISSKEALEGLLRSYSQFISSDLAKYEANIQQACARLTTENISERLSELSDEIITNLKDWKSLISPIVSMEGKKGRDEPRASSLFSSIRDTCLQLANDRDEYIVALKLTDAEFFAFSELPQASEQLEADRTQLQKLLRQKRDYEQILPLSEAINEAKKDFKKLIQDLKKEGFSASSGGSITKIYNEFISCVDATRGTDGADNPWILIRDLALELNNEYNEPIATRAIIVGISIIAKNTLVTPKVREFLEADAAQLERNILEQELVASFEAKKSSKSIDIIRKLLINCNDEKEKETFLALMDKAKQEQRSSYVRWGFWAIFVGFIAYANIFDARKPTNLPPNNYVYPTNQDNERASPAANSRSYEETTSGRSMDETNGPLTESKPEAGEGLSLGRANVRYCLFQEARLNALRELVKENDTINSFNQLTHDWNNRCGNYKYLERDMNAVKSELSQNLEYLKSQAQGMYDEWHKALAGSVQSEPMSVKDSVEDKQLTETQELDLLKLDDAIRIQNRLHELGYLKTKANGVWGQNSRKALLAFKIVNGLPPDDILNADTSASLLSPAAKSGTLGSLPRVRTQLF